MKLSIISPAFNEEDIIESFIKQVRKTLQESKLNQDYEILIVMDKSDDSTFSILERLCKDDPHLKVIEMSSRFGHQMALLAGIDHATGDALVMIDSDLQHPPELIPQMVDKYLEGHDIVFTVRDDDEAFGFFKRLSSRLFYKILNRLSSIPIHSSASDFRLISKKVANVFRHDLRERNYFMRGLISWVGFSTTSIHFKTRERTGGVSKYSIKHLLTLALNGIIGFSKRPLQWAIYVGIIFSILGFLMAWTFIYLYFSGSHFPSGWATLATMIPIFSGVQLIFLGVIGQYVGAIFDEVKSRPHYIIDRTRNLPD